MELNAAVHLEAHQDALKLLILKSKAIALREGNQFGCLPKLNIKPLRTCSVTTCPCIPANVPWITSSNVNTRSAPALIEERETMCEWVKMEILELTTGL